MYYTICVVLCEWPGVVPSSVQPAKLRAAIRLNNDSGDANMIFHTICVVPHSCFSKVITITFWSYLKANYLCRCTKVKVMQPYTELTVMMSHAQFGTTQRPTFTTVYLNR